MDGVCDRKKIKNVRKRGEGHKNVRKRGKERKGERGSKAASAKDNTQRMILFDCMHECFARTLIAACSRETPFARAKSCLSENGANVCVCMQE